jgi:hypothetical protein
VYGSIADEIVYPTIRIGDADVTDEWENVREDWNPTPDDGERIFLLLFARSRRAAG